MDREALAEFFLDDLDDTNCLDDTTVPALEGDFRLGFDQCFGPLDGLPTVSDITNGVSAFVDGSSQPGLPQTQEQSKSRPCSNIGSDNALPSTPSVLTVESLMMEGMRDNQDARKSPFSDDILPPAVLSLPTVVTQLESNDQEESPKCSTAPDFETPSDSETRSKRKLFYGCTEPTNKPKQPKSEIQMIPSRFCHVCARTSKVAAQIICGNIRLGTCRKVVCEKCFEQFGWNWEAASKSDDWICCHCVGCCPERAQCSTYCKVNAKLRKERSRSKVVKKLNSEAKKPTPKRPRKEAQSQFAPSLSGVPPPPPLPPIIAPETPSGPFSLSPTSPSQEEWGSALSGPAHLKLELRSPEGEE